jgi:hypothetical protein
MVKKKIPKIHCTLKEHNIGYFSKMVCHSKDGVAAVREESDKPPYSEKKLLDIINYVPKDDLAIEYINVRELRTRFLF